MTRPSEPLLAWLRDLLKQRGMNVARLASLADLPRARVRRVLAGAEPMLLDELLTLTQALEVQPSDLGLPDQGAPSEASAASQPEDAPAADADAAEGDADAEIEPTVDPWGNHPRQLVQIGFALGCDFSLILDTSLLGDSGMPAHVIERYNGGPMRIQLDAAYHQYNQPRYQPHGVTLTLSFDALYDCTLPWASLQQVLFVPAAPIDEPDEPDEPSDDGRPRLRLVT